MKPQTKLSLIVASGQNGVIGKDGMMPWKLASDMAHFKRITSSKPVLMGRKTWQSLFVQPLPGRINLVLSRNADFVAKGAKVFTDLGAMIKHAKSLGADEAMVIGGGALYEVTLPLCDRVYLTKIDASFEGDTVFAPLDPKLWQLVQQQPYPASEGDDYSFVTQVYERR